MKKILLGALIIAGMAVNAQITSGQLFTGGAFSLKTTGGTTDNIVTGTTTTKDNASSFTFKLIPQVGFMITENIGAGLGIGYQYYSRTTPNAIPGTGTDIYDQVEKTGTFIINPFVRYYKSVTEKFYIFGEASLPIAMVNYSSLKLNDNGDGTVDDDRITKGSGFGLGLALGANYFVTDNIALEAGFNLFGISYTHTKTTNTDKDEKNGDIKTSSSFNFDLDTDAIFNTGNISVGVKFFF